MYRNKLVLAALSSALVVAAAGASFAAPNGGPHRPRPHAMMGGPHRPRPREIAFVRMLKQFDENKDGKISKQEATDGLDKVFAAIDSNNDGSLTPGEIRQYRQAEHAKRKTQNAETGANNAAPAAPQTADNGGQNRQQQRDGRRWMRHGGNVMLAAMMRRIDTDENGQISKAEATAAFDKFFARMDRNKDGYISIDDMPDQPLL